MPIFQMGKFTPNALMISIVSSSVLLSACTLDEESNSAPEFNEIPVSSNTFTVGQEYNDQLIATDSDGDALLYTAINKPDWLTLSQSGKLSSSALTDSDIGTFDVTFKAQDSESSTQATVTFTVLNSLPSAPTIETDSMTVNTGILFNEKLSATDLGTSSLSFNLVSSTLKDEATDWLEVVMNEDKSYSLKGTADVQHAGDTAVVVSVTDGMDSVESVFTITAEIPPANEAPGIPTLDNDQATEGVGFTTKLSASDLENDTLIFSLDGTNNPTWLSLNNDVLSGTPGSFNVGQNDFSIIVSDGINVNSAITVSIEVSGTAPTNLVITNNDSATEDTLFNALLSATTDTNDDILTFTIETGPSWLTIDSASGALSGTPSVTDIGSNTFTTKASDFNNAFIELNFDIEVVAKPIVNVAPTFNSEILYKSGGVDVSDFSLANQTLVADASDTNGDELTFTKVDGPDWLVIESDGALSGTLSLAENNTFTVEVSDPEGETATATLNITRATFKAEELTTTAAPVGRAFSGVLSGNNAHDSQDTLSYSEIDGDSADLFNTTVDGSVTSPVLTVNDIAAHTVQFSVTNGVQLSETNDIGTNLVTKINVVAVNAVTGAADIFGPKAPDISGWVNESSVNSLTANNNAPLVDGRYLRIKGGSRAIKYFDTSRFTGITVSYDRLFQSLNTADEEIFGAEWSADGVNWELIEPESNNDLGGDAWVSVGPIALPVGAVGQPILAIRFRTNGMGNLSRVHIDNVTITGTP